MRSCGRRELSFVSHFNCGLEYMHEVGLSWAHPEIFLNVLPQSFASVLEFDLLHWKQFLYKAAKDYILKRVGHIEREAV